MSNAVLRGPLANVIRLESMGLRWSNAQPIGDGQWGVTAEPTGAFWEAWRQHKDILRTAGYACKKRGADWIVTKLCEPPAEPDVPTASGVAYPDPPGLKSYPYQMDGIAFALQRDGCLIADAPGVGKSRQAVGVIDYSGAESALIICPASLRINWARECNMWLTRKMSIGVVRNGRKPALPETSIVIINYELVHKYDAEIKSRKWGVLVCDEAHALRNGTKTRFGAHIIGNRNKGTKPIRADRKVFLTGTPIVNRPGELWPLIHFLDPAYWSSPLLFARQYCDSPPGAVSMKGASNLDQLQAALKSSVMIRRLKEDVLKDLPPKTRQLMTMPSTGAENEIMAEMEAFQNCKDKIADLRARFEVSKASAVEGDYKAAIHGLREGIGEAFAVIARARKAVAIAKLPTLLDYLDEQLENGGKLVVFCHHREVHDAITQHLGKKCVGIIGGTSLTARQAAVDRFQKDDSVRVFVGSIMAAGTGLTLTASSHVIMAELDWTPSNIVQCEDRCHRVGQASNVLAQWLVLEDSLDARIAKVLMDKAAIIEKALDYKPGSEIAVTDRQDLNGKMSLFVSDKIATAKASRETILSDAERISERDSYRLLELLKLVEPDGDVDARVISGLTRSEAMEPAQAALALRILRQYAQDQLSVLERAEVDEIWERVTGK